MVAQRRNGNKKNFKRGRGRGKRLTPEQEEKKREAARLEKIRKQNNEEWKKLRTEKNTCVIPGHEGWLADRIRRHPVEFSNKVTGRAIPIEHYFFYPTRNRLPPKTQASLYPGMKERMNYLEKQGDFMFFYKNYPNLVRDTNIRMRMPPSAFPEEWEKYCDHEGWFEPENATRRGRRKMKFAIERYKRKNSSFMKGTREGQETDWDLIDDRNNERNERGMLYTNQY